MTIIAACSSFQGVASRRSVISENVGEADSLTVSIITCYPGPEIYELCGHAAIRVRGNDVDSVWNYGMFSFNEPNFVYRFVKGETDYMVAGYPFAWFMPEYVKRGSKVVEQDLLLTPQEARKVRELLQINALEQNRTYRYNYVKDNCATRLINIVEQAVGQRMILRDTTRYNSYRAEMRNYHQNYPWYQLGIDVALGQGLDKPIDNRQQMFVPVEMMHTLQSAERNDGRKIVAQTRTLYEGTETAVNPPTPIWLSPLLWSIIVAAIAVVIAVVDCRRKHISKLWYCIYFSLLGVAGCIVTFLVFCSSHEATSPNLLIFWLNPLWLIAAVCVWSKRMKIVTLLISVFEIITTGGLLVLWPLQQQETNAALFPQMCATILLCVAYTILSKKDGYKKEGRNLSTKRSGAKKQNRKPVAKKR